jgi:hypothetical protein
VNLLYLRKALPWLTAAIVIVVAYDGWIFYSRWSARQQARELALQRAAENARRALQVVGGGGLKILSFYATSRSVARGGKANVCYGVTGAKTVRLEPDVERLHPSLSYCFQVAPERDTKYRLIADDGAGHTATESFVLQVK